MGNKTPQKKKEKSAKYPTFWQGVGYLVVKLADRGNFATAVLTIFFIIFLLKADGEQLGRLPNRVLDLMVTGDFIGWVGFGILLLYQTIIVRPRLHQMDAEIKQIASGERLKLKSEKD